MYAMNKNERCIYLRISENNTSTAGIFYGELGLAVLTCSRDKGRLIGEERWHPARPSNQEWITIMEGHPR